MYADIKKIDLFVGFFALMIAGGLLYHGLAVLFFAANAGTMNFN